jgi:hypothetical protein
VLTEGFMMAGIFLLKIGVAVAFGLVILALL